jgi:hypothetical protein
MVSKIFSIAAALLLVGAFALATLGPPDQTLGQLLADLDATFVQTIREWSGREGLPWLWGRVMLPLLVRPSWLVPACLGLVCVGGAASTRSKDAPRGQHRRS